MLRAPVEECSYVRVGIGVGTVEPRDDDARLSVHDHRLLHRLHRVYVFRIRNHADQVVAVTIREHGRRLDGLSQPEPVAVVIAAAVPEDATTSRAFRLETIPRNRATGWGPSGV